MPLDCDRPRSRLKSLRQRRSMDDLVFVLERRSLSVRVFVTLTNTFHHCDRRVLGRRAFLATIRKTVNQVIWVSAVEEWHGVPLFTRLVDDSVEVADVTIIGPVSVSLSIAMLVLFPDSPSHEHVSEVYDVCAFDWSNL
jgi:hypothetical protein